MIDHVDNPFESISVLSICTGIGGLERGVERVVGPIRTIAYVEIEAFIIENLLAGMEAGILAPAPIWANLKTFPWEQFRGKVGLLMGGYPCQPFSTAGQRKGADDPRHLWPFIERGIGTIRPLCCFFENVAGHLSLGFEQVAHSLRAMGYAVEAGIYTAEEVGAPHKRARLFVVAILADTKGQRSGEARRLFERSQKWASCSGETMDDPIGRSIRRDQQDKRQADRNEHETSNAGDGEQLAYATSGIGSGTWWGEGGQSLQFGASLADSLSQGLEKRQEQSTREEQPAIKRGRGALADANIRREQQRNAAGVGCMSQRFSWPSRPGEQQHSGEPPRTIEPGLGCIIDGYNFREDLLRALGNGVVEQTAELAFRDLLRKHFT